MMPIAKRAGIPAARPFVLSIRPTYVERILDGRKTIELRRRFPATVAPAAIALLYSTSPVQAIVGWTVLEQVSKLPLRALWRQFGAAASVSREEFEAYFRGTDQGCALRLTRVRQFPEPIHLTDLTSRFEFSPPQSYCYWRQSLSALAAHGRVEALT